MHLIAYHLFYTSQNRTTFLLVYRWDQHILNRTTVDAYWTQTSHSLVLSCQPRGVSHTFMRTCLLIAYACGFTLKAFIQYNVMECKIQYIVLSCHSTHKVFNNFQCWYVIYTYKYILIVGYLPHLCYDSLHLHHA